MHLSSEGSTCECSPQHTAGVSRVRGGPYAHLARLVCTCTARFIPETDSTVAASAISSSRLEFQVPCCQAANHHACYVHLSNHMSLRMAIFFLNSACHVTLHNAVCGWVLLLAVVVSPHPPPHPPPPPPHPAGSSLLRRLLISRAACGAA